MALRRYDDAIAEYKRAVEIDPLWGLSYDHLVGALYQVGRIDEGREYVRRFLSLSTDQRSKLLVLRGLYDFESRLGDELKVTRALERAYPDERSVRLNYATALAVLGERREAAKIVDYDRIGQAALSGDWSALARSAEALGPQFWDQSGYWNAASLLVVSGHSASLVRLYDQVRPEVDRGHVDVQKILVPELIVALRQSGRQADARALLSLYRRYKAQLPDRGLLGDDKAVGQGVIAALTGDRETAMRTLDSWSKRNPFRLLALPAMALRYDPVFGSLASDPRFPAIEERIRIAVNNERAKGGLPAISHVDWISDPATLLTKN
jgi:tetratricopeptide (TPR) repeat protein